METERLRAFIGEGGGGGARMKQRLRFSITSLLPYNECFGNFVSVFIRKEKEGGEGGRAGGKEEGALFLHVFPTPLSPSSPSSLFLIYQMISHSQEDYRSQEGEGGGERESWGGGGRREEKYHPVISMLFSPFSAPTSLRLLVFLGQAQIEFISRLLLPITVGLVRHRSYRIFAAP